MRSTLVLNHSRLSTEASKTSAHSQRESCVQIHTFSNIHHEHTCMDVCLCEYADVVLNLMTEVVLVLAKTDQNIKPTSENLFPQPIC